MIESDHSGIRRVIVEPIRVAARPRRQGVFRTVGDGNGIRNGGDAMGYSNTLGVQTGELGQLGNDVKISGGAVKDTVKRISDNKFGSADAGKNYAAEGKTVAAGIDVAIAWLNNWSSATTAIGDAIGASSIAYSNTDAENAKQTNKAGQAL
ncbi:hypothetical protein [Nocardia fluminea]|nr:hypothetical protein [Nocardia fluminea]